MSAIDTRRQLRVLADQLLPTPAPRCDGGCGRSARHLVDGRRVCPQCYRQLSQLIDRAIEALWFSRDLDTIARLPLIQEPE